MKTLPNFKRFSAVFLFALMMACVSVSVSQPKYRTFNQDDLAEKKAKDPGKRVESLACFMFHNTLSSNVNSLHVKFSTEIGSIQDSGGFTSIVLPGKKKLDASGRVVVAGDSVEICIVFQKKEGHPKVEKWWWDSSGTRKGPVNDKLLPSSITFSYKQPNGGTVRDYVYKHFVKHSKGLYVGTPTDTPGVGWIRYKDADRKFFPHTDIARCFDVIMAEHGGHPFTRELKNPHVKKHNNHLLGETHALKLAVLANDSGVTEPLSATALGDLIYNDLGNPGDPGNGKTVRQLLALTDSALTYCSHFSSSIYSQLDSCVSRVNRAFDGEYVAVTFTPFLIAGTHTVSESPYLHPNPSAVPIAMRHSSGSILDVQPERFGLMQNYPNPFNPTTTIQFDLTEQSMVTLKIYNMIGQEITTLLNSESIEDGSQSVEFDASNLPSGVYLYKIVAQGIESGSQFQAIKKMVLLK